MKPRRRLSGGVALAAASILVGLAMCEAIIRIFDLGPEIHAVYRDNYRLSKNPALRYELVPGSKDEKSRINRDGMRDPERSEKKPPGSFRIAAMGDSITYGFGVSQSESWPAQLEQILNRADPGRRVQVLNFGVTGYDLSQSLENLRARALRYQPDLVIYQYCLNDPEKFSSEMESLLAELSRAQASYWEGAIHGSGWLGFSRLAALARYALHSAFAGGGGTRLPRADLQWHAIHQGSWADYYAKLHSDPESWRRIENGLLELETLTVEAGIPALLVTFPIFLDLDHYPLASVHDRVRGAARERSFAALDLLPAYTAQATSNLAVNALHPNARGHRLAARAIAAFLLEEGLLPLAPESAVDPDGL